MRQGDPCDPLLRQVLPTHHESLQQPGFVADPLDERAARRAPGLLEKYARRALLMPTGACAIHCRYCFRRHRPVDAALDRQARAAALARLADDETVDEVILSGGDPLMLDDGQLAELIGELEGLKQLSRLRLHTRLPVVLPSRVTQGLCTLLESTRFTVVVVLHVNHAHEIDRSVVAALDDLRRAGALLLNQSVFLAGVNDDVTALAALSQALVASGVIPYYLHMLDPVEGASHFATSTACALSVVERLRARLPGYLVPRLVREDPGAQHKTALA